MSIMFEEREKSDGPDLWEDELYETTSAILKTQLHNWCKIVNTVGFTSDVKKEWIETFVNQIEGTCQAMLEETNGFQNEVMEKIELSLEKCRSLCKDLHLIMPRFGSEKLTLLQEYEKLKKYIEECEILHTKICKEIQTLKDQELQLCKILGQQPKGLQDFPLPTKSQIEYFKNYLEQLESLKFIRLEEFLGTKSDILKLTSELKYQSKTDFEKLVLNTEESLFHVTEQNMKNLQQFHTFVKELYEETKNKISGIKEEVTTLWRFLKEDTHKCDLFLINHVENNLAVLEAWKQELNRCRDIKKQNIEMYVKCIRQELSLMYHKCHMDENKVNFKYFHSDFFTEDLLSLHEREMDKMQKYYDKTSEIIHLIEKREKLCKKMSELQIKSCAPDRFKNRGGQLLQEEKERNALKKTIPKLEEQIKVLSSRYELSNKEAFLSWGKTVAEIITMTDDKQNVLKSTTKQQQTDATPSTKISNYVCKSASAAKTGTVKRNLITPDNYQVKRRKILQENNINEPQSVPCKVNTNRCITEKTVVNYGRQTPAAKLRLQENELLEYKNFQSVIEEKDDCRSTMVPTIIIDDSMIDDLSP